MYAEALYKAEQRKAAKEHSKNLVTALKRRGHLALLPRIVAEYEKLAERDERSKKYKEVTPESEQTRVLLELYQKLVHDNG
jgi:F0F1-type ATP synthase delta subunit